VLVVTRQRLSPRCSETREDTPTSGLAVQTRCSVQTRVERCDCVGNVQWGRRTTPQPDLCHHQQ